jgi:hypothetical protein
MAFDMDYAFSLDRLADSVRAAHEPSLVILSKILDEACARIHNLGQSAKDRIIRLAELDAWNEVALALIELELPAWQIRRLASETASGSARYRGSPICQSHSMTVPRPHTVLCHWQSCVPFLKRVAAVDNWL